MTSEVNKSNEQYDSKCLKLHLLVSSNVYFICPHSRPCQLICWNTTPARVSFDGKYQNLENTFIIHIALDFIICKILAVSSVCP